MNDYNFRFNKSFGQNFLREENIVAKIVSSATITQDDLVIEIGPGSGMLTKQLSPKAKQVICYEIDKRLEAILDNNLKSFSNINIIYEDFLKRDISKDLEKYNYKDIYVVANLPYYITTPIITKIIDSKIKIKQLVIMVQKEVGDRFCAIKGSKEYGSLTVFLNYYFILKKQFVVGKNSFIPKPNVDSVVLSLTSREIQNPAINENEFIRLVKDSFRFKRKSIKNNLKQYNLDIIANVLDKYGFNLSTRAEELPLEVFVDISNELNTQ